MNFSFLLVYNNAHIQTQKELKKGESSTNVSVIVPDIILMKGLRHFDSGSKNRIFSSQRI